MPGKIVAGVASSRYAGRLEGALMVMEAITEEDYRATAVERARAVAAALESRGVELVITGSLGRGEFGRGSDVDFVVLKCPRRLKYAIEGIVEDGLGGIPFDVVYQEEIPPSKLRRFMVGAVHARNLR